MGAPITFGAVYTDKPGQPPLPTRLMAGLAILKHTYDLSDEALCDRWVENPYSQSLFAINAFSSSGRRVEAALEADFYFCSDLFGQAAPQPPRSLLRLQRTGCADGTCNLISDSILEENRVIKTALISTCGDYQAVRPRFTKSSRISRSFFSPILVRT